MYGEARMRIHQQTHTLAEPWGCFIKQVYQTSQAYFRLILNQINWQEVWLTDINLACLLTCLMKQPLFVLRVIYNKPYITDALSDLSWTAVLVRAELCVEKRTVQYFIFYRETSHP